MHRSLTGISRFVFAGGLAAALFFAGRAPAQPAGHEADLRPPAVPLVASDPYLSIWSMSDTLNGDTTRHWTRHPHPLVSLIRVDGKSYRLMGAEPKDIPPIEQKSVQVFPTRTIYEFANESVRVSLTFTTPSLPDDLDVLARPLTYLTWDVRSADGKNHEVSLFESTSALLTVNEPAQKVEWKREAMGDLTALRAGTVDQTLLQPAGDDTRIDWGYVYLAAPTSQTSSAMGASTELAASFAERGTLTDRDDAQMPRAANDHEPALAFAFALGSVGDQPVSRHLMIAYDEIYSIKFLGQKQRPFWRRNGAGPKELFADAARDYAKLVDRCKAFDEELMADLTQTGGIRFARMCALAYRQALAGCGLSADANGQPMLFPKENSSNGCVATVDVFYPAAPQFLLMGPTYAKALVAPALVYSTSKRWKFPFAPHDVGTYPQANGQVYGGGEESKNEADMMPVEESGNMILLCAAIAKMDGNADFASKWWTQLTQWEGYLEKYGEDPENQLCTDDFMGHLAHNANLSVKAILAIAAYGEMCKMRGDVASAEKYHKLARQYAEHWMKMAGDGDHYRIAFDKPNTWSQKYNLVWDKLLDLDVFPAEVAQKEVAYYKKVMQKYGLPLDSRTRLTKSDWCLWTATLASDRGDFEAIVNPIYDYLNETTARLPFVDSFITDNKKSDGMRARPVIGGLFIKMLENDSTWKKWAGRDRFQLGEYAPAPVPPKITEVVPTSRTQPITWQYTTRRPAEGWSRSDFDAQGWKEGPGAFGTRGTPGINPETDWNTPDIWMRREITMPANLDPARVQLFLYHDENAEVYIDGILAAREPGYGTTYQPIEISEAARARLKPGARLVIAVHCHQTGGGQGIDLGFVDVSQKQP